MDQTELIYRIFAIIFPIFAITAAGCLYARIRRDSDLSTGNRSNMEMFTPALIFDAMSSSSYALADYAPMMIGCAVIVLGSGLLAWPVAALAGYSRKTLLPPMMFNNCGNMGLPLAVLTFGDAMLPAGILLLAVSNTLHFTLGTQLVSGRWSLRTVLLNPMIVATLAGVGVSIAGIELPAILRQPIHMLGQIAIPLMLFSLGMRMLSIDFRDSGIGLLGALLCPLSGLVFALGFLALIPLPGDQAALLILFGVLPPAVLNYMVAERYGQEPARVASIVLFGNLASMAVIPIALWFVL